jgi:hypothetical protein
VTRRRRPEERRFDSHKPPTSNPNDTLDSSPSSNLLLLATASALARITSFHFCQTTAHSVGGDIYLFFSHAWYVNFPPALAESAPSTLHIECPIFSSRLHHCDNNFFVTLVLVRYHCSSLISAPRTFHLLNIDSSPLQLRTPPPLAICASLTR